MKIFAASHRFDRTRRTVLLLAIALTAGQAFADAPTAGLAAWYPFPGNPADYSGNGRHGTVNGAVLAADRFANPEEAYSFDGTDDSISVAYAPTLVFTTGLTASFWVRFNKVATTGAPCFDWHTLFAKDLYSTLGLMLCTDSTCQGTLRFYHDGLTPAFSDYQWTGVQINTWYHVVVTYGGGYARHYIDGAPVAEIAVTGTLAANTKALFLGRNNPGATSCTYPLDGRMDDVRFYDRALTPAEVQDLYAETAPLRTYDVTVSGAPSANGAWSGTNPDIWAPSGTGANVAVSEIQSRLNAGTGVTVLTHVGGGTESGDIVIKNALSWSAGALTLQAARNIHIDAVMTATGTSALAMTAASGAVKTGFAPGECNSFAGRVDFPGRSGTGFLTVNGAGYTVIDALGAAGSTTGTDLQGISGALGGKYALGADIDASATLGWNGGEGFLPLGDSAAKFTGAFDGLGHTVSGLKINRPATDHVGLFGYAQAAELRNVGLPGLRVSAHKRLGGLVGWAEYSALDNVYVGSSGVSQYVHSGMTTANDTNIGGLAGYFAYTTLSDAYACRTDVRGDSFEFYISIAGGLVGNNSLSTISNAYSSDGGHPEVGVLFVQSRAGGLVGASTGTIANCYTSGGIVTLSSGAPNITGIGGLVGLNGGAIINSYSVGKILDAIAAAPAWPMGGLVGTNSRTIINSYATTDPAHTSYVNGLVGHNQVGATITNSFWDKEASSVTVSDGGTGLTTAEMRDLDTFSSIWDIDATAGTGQVWRIYDTRTYPLLRSYLAPLTATANDHARQYTGVGYSGGNGVSISPAGYDASKVFGNPASLTYSGDSQGAVDLGTYAIVPAGLWSGQPGYDIGYAPGTLTIVPGVVGRVPDGGSGAPLAISRNLTQLHLEWGASCGTLATDFAVYEGALGDWDSHSSLVCSTGGAPSATVTPSSGDRYYLIVPLSATHEGSYGTTSGGTEIPASLSPCMATQDLSGCP